MTVLSKTGDVLLEIEAAEEAQRDLWVLWGGREAGEEGIA
jgi:hypothetical protein